MNKISSIIRKDTRWVSVKAPSNLKKNVMDQVYAYSVQKIIWLKVMKYAALTVSAVVILLSSLLWLSHHQVEKVVMVYPYHGETKVELVGSFNDWKEKVNMRLDEQKSAWVIELYLRKDRIYEYQFLVDEVIYTTGNAENTIRRDDGYDKALLFI